MSSSVPKIAFYCSSISWGGLEMNLVRYASWMGQRGWQVVVIGVENSRIYDECHHLGLSFIAVKRNRKYFDLPAAIRLKRLLKQERVSVLWFRDNRDLSLMSMVKRIFYPRVVVVYQQAMQLGVPKKDFFHTLRFRAIDIWISTNAYLAAQVKAMTRFPQERLHVVPLGTPVPQPVITRHEAREDYGIPSDALVLGVIGRFDKLKGQQELVDAFLEIAADFPHVHLLLVGESTLNEGTAYLDNLKRIATDSPFAERIHFGPFIRQTEKFFLAADVFVMASYAETFGMVTIEAMSYGLPVIGTNTAGTPDLIEWGRAGALCEPRSSSSLSNVLRTCLTDPEWLQRSSRNSTEIFRQRFEKDSTLKSIEALLGTYGLHTNP